MGYFLNRSAIKYLHCAEIYFGDFLRASVYEDLAVADILCKLAAKTRYAPMKKILNSVGAY